MEPSLYLLRPDTLYSRESVLARPCPVPERSGIYAWYFKNIPPRVPVADCVKNGEYTLLYVGISPSRIESTQSLRKRIRYHYRGNAAGSTLRLTLGVLLRDVIEFSLRRVGSADRMTFTHVGEQALDEWMGQNAFVCWVEHSAPWSIEAEILKSVSLPLNLVDNEHHPFYGDLRRIRAEAKRSARSEPHAVEHNQRRQID